MTCAHVSPEVVELQAQLAAERLARQLAEARLEGFCRALTLLSPARGPEAPPVVAATAGEVLAQQSREGYRAAGTAPWASVTGSVTAQRHSVTGSVTQEEKKRIKREKTAERTRIYRIRLASVTPPSPPSVTASHTSAPHPSPPSPAQVTKGALRVVSAAARESRQAPTRVYATPDTLPGPVRELREAWNALVAPHGFSPWPERTPARLVEDAQAALERRPLEEWRRVFGLVPRSPVCRGELASGQRAGIVWLLVGRTRGGYEPAEALLSGTWSVDPEPREEGAQEGARALPQASSRFPALPDGAPARKAWEAILAGFHRDGRKYALQWLARLAPVGTSEGRLQLGCEDTYCRDWVGEHYAELLQGAARAEGLTGVELVLPPGGSATEVSEPGS